MAHPSPHFSSTPAREKRLRPVETNQQEIESWNRRFSGLCNKLIAAQPTAQTLLAKFEVTRQSIRKRKDLRAALPLARLKPHNPAAQNSLATPSPCMPHTSRRETETAATLRANGLNQGGSNVQDLFGAAPIAWPGEGRVTASLDLAPLFLADSLRMLDFLRMCVFEMLALGECASSVSHSYAAIAKVYVGRVLFCVCCEFMETG